MPDLFAALDPEPQPALGRNDADRPLADRPPSLRQDTVRKVGNTPFFTDQVDFALLTTIELSPSNAGQVFGVANKLLHFSPEPIVVEKLIESLILLQQDAEASYYIKRYQAAFPEQARAWQETFNNRRAQQ